MKALDIIDALTRNCTENTGLVTTPCNKSELLDWVKSWFGGDCDEITCSAKLKTNRKYVYVYGQPLFTLKGYHSADCVVKVTLDVSADYNECRKIEEEIYLYEVEM